MCQIERKGKIDMFARDEEIKILGKNPKHWTWTEKSQMQLKDNHDAGTGFSETREVLVLQGSQPNRRSVCVGGDQLWFLSFCLYYSSRKAWCEREGEPDWRLDHLWPSWSCIVATQ